ncbi:hypothetical protein [Natronosalvus rutilus]|uniref:CopG family transcriptional regulator n=1 Tax=Natronosalvus rutilus TaxID=2953753 RepID=A0A9E7SVJ7_9EURY|nr:hypothetical protein [Natronosalvus rutilus]UTF54057.1 hypothetical protein NGM29_01865 [Natronosalvus rutilus]
MSSEHAALERDERESITLPSGLVSRIEARLPRSDFDSADEYVAFVMREVLTSVEAETETDDYEGAAQEEVEARLESLGYLE